MRGHAEVSFDFFYLKWADIVQAFTSYVKERQADSIQLISINPNSLAFIQDIKHTTSDNVFIIPTKATILRGYQGGKDVKGILPTIKNTVS